nr:hypothetical protein REQ54_01737 [Rhizobium sp. Q54]
MAELVTLRAFLAAYEHEPWTPGEKVDCCLIIAEWAKWLGYPDPVSDFRGTYEPGQGQIDILAAHGGALPLVEAAALSIGARRVAVPQAGDFGVVGSAKNITRQFGVIHDGQGWLTRAPDGFKRITAKTLAAWRL